ncbi:hypothetical protein ACQP2U_43375 (plasmid) [Nocardia sp. CA-084685]|uniref:hypothetical protein n=1 Tax=Nocardia sp. CA-084685 TaxID=3239970 RepID=UPI003D967245
MSARIFARTATTVLTIAVMAAPGLASAQPPGGSTRDVKHCSVLNTDVCLEVWSEFGIVKAQPSGPKKYDFFLVDYTDAAGATRHTTTAGAAITLGRSSRYTVTTQGVDDAWLRTSGSTHSDRVTVTWP